LPIDLQAEHRAFSLVAGLGPALRRRLELV
jgi:hypothetical protein